MYHDDFVILNLLLDTLQTGSLPSSCTALAGRIQKGGDDLSVQTMEQRKCLHTYF